MRLTKFTDYALRVVMYLARHPDGWPRLPTSRANTTFLPLT